MPKLINGTFRMFYVGKDAASKQAEKILKDSGIKFYRCLVPTRKYDTIEEPKPPCLITGEGRFSGIEGIRVYVTGMK